MSLEKLREWVGRTQSVEDFAAPFPVRALIATFDEKDPDPKTGDPLPPLWHWLYFLEAAPLSKVGAGRPCRARRLPAAGAAAAPHVGGQPLRLHRPAAPGRRDDPPLLADQVGRAQDRHRPASMVFVTVEHTVSGPDGVSFVEEHDIVYREAAKPGETQRDPKPAPTDATWSKKIMADPVLLFRFSALTFNGHRIHYDQPYVTGTEGYPGLIVHGPLMGMVQIELARRANPGKIPRSFEFRALAPVYAGAAFSVQARREADGGVTTWIADRNGGLAQQGRATFQ